MPQTPFKPRRSPGAGNAVFDFDTLTFVCEARMSNIDALARPASRRTNHPLAANGIPACPNLAPVTDGDTHNPNAITYSAERKNSRQGSRNGTRHAWSEARDRERSSRRDQSPLYRHSGLQQISAACSSPLVVHARARDRCRRGPPAMASRCALWQMSYSRLGSKSRVSESPIMQAAR